jgi:hypothetical protein
MSTLAGRPGLPPGIWRVPLSFWSMTTWEPPQRWGFLPGTEQKWAAYYELRNPYDRAVAYLRVGRADHIEDALWLLEKRPRFHGSGYLTERMLQVIDRAPLSANARKRVIAGAEAIAKEGYTREVWPAMRLLARLGVQGWEDELRTRGERAERWRMQRWRERRSANHDN